MYLQRKQRKRTGLDGNAPKEDQTVTTVGRSRDDKLGVARFWRTRMTGGDVLGWGGELSGGELSRGKMSYTHAILLSGPHCALQYVRLSMWTSTSSTESRNNSTKLLEIFPAARITAWCNIEVKGHAVTTTGAIHLVYCPALCRFPWRSGKAAMFSSLRYTAEPNGCPRLQIIRII